MTTIIKPKKESLTADQVVAALERDDSELIAVIQKDRDWIWIPSEMTEGKDDGVVARRKLLSSLGFRFRGSGDREINGVPCRWAHNCGVWTPRRRKGKSVPTVSAESSSDAIDLSDFGM